MAVEARLIGGPFDGHREAGLKTPPPPKLLAWDCRFCACPHADVPSRDIPTRAVEYVYLGMDGLGALYRFGELTSDDFGTDHKDKTPTRERELVPA